MSDNPQPTFDQVRNNIQCIIEQNKTYEVTNTSHIHKAGVYMLYVDCFSDDTIIPFYIGQTNDFQERHKQHFSEIMALNRLHRECYEYALFADLYNGHARPCKIFSFMVNHRCSLNDLHMIVLETIEDEAERLQTEQKYIDELYAPFFGFNQLNSVLRYIDVQYRRIDKKEYISALKQDIELILQFPSYGYGLYNWYRSCETIYKAITAKQPVPEIPEPLHRIHDSKKRLNAISLRRIEIKNYNGWEAPDEVWNICKETINEFFKKRKLRSEDKKQLIAKIILFNFEDDRNQLEKYFSKYSDRIDEDIFVIIDSIHGTEISPIKQKVADNQSEYRALEDEKKALDNIVLGSLLPKPYKSHPLGDMEKRKNFDVSVGKDNVCYLNIEFTCFRADFDNNCYPEVTKVDYCVINKGTTTERTTYIENSLTSFFARDDVYYCESGFRYGPFNPCLRGRVDSFIPISMEYRNGINEWSLRDKETENFKKVFREINQLIDEKTKVIYSTSGYKSTILRFVDCKGLSETVLAKKLKRICK